MSCDNNEKLLQNEASENEAMRTVDESYQNLNYQLECYNKNFQENRLANSSETRSFWSWLKRVGKADALGAVSGGILGGGTAIIYGKSWGDVGKVALFGALFVGICNSVIEAIDYFAPNKSGYSTMVASLPEILASEGNSTADSIGYYHNLIIQELYLEDKDVFSKDFSIIQQRILNHMNKHGFAPVAEVIKTLPSKIELVQQCLDMSDKEAVVFLTAKYPESKNEIAIFGNYMQNLSTLQSKYEVMEYSTGFRDVVTSSQIPQSSVNFIQASVSVTANSAILWSTDNK